MEERFFGLTLHDLLFASAGQGLRDTMTVEDWRSLLWQGIMTHVVLHLTTGVVHRDAHGLNVVVHVLQRPIHLEYVVEGTGVRVKTCRSNLLLQRMDWSEGLPAKSMSSFLRRAFAC